MPSQFTAAERAAFRKIMEDLPESERAKIKVLLKTGRLVGFVVFLDAVVHFFERLGAIGGWINKVLRPVLTGAAVVVVIYLVATGKIHISELWK